MRTTYSLLCSELASNGFFVAAIEHKLSLSKFSLVYAYLGAYAYCFGEIFQGLYLFGGLRLLGSLE